MVPAPSPESNPTPTPEGGELAPDHPTPSALTAHNLGSLALKAGVVCLVVAASFYFTDRSMIGTGGLRPAGAIGVATFGGWDDYENRRADLSQHLSPDLDLGPGIDPGNYRLSDTGPEPSEMAEDADPDAASERVILVRRGDTFSDLLIGAGVAKAEAREAITALRRVIDPSKAIRPGQEVTLTFGAPPNTGEQPTLLQASLTPRADQAVNLNRSSDGRFFAFRRERALSRELVRATATVRSSMFEAGSAAGLPGAVTVEVIRAFSYDVDFQRDIQAGDRFEVLFERYRDDSGRFVRDGAVLYAALTLGKTTLHLYRYTAPDGFTDYFNERGESVRKALLRTPVDGARLSSGFGSRLHPILGYTAMHRGADFAAPVGTPIQAAGDGVIEQSGWNGAYGNYIRIRHTSDYATAYAHMSRIAPGAQMGARVRQGQVVGYVGATGRVTGAHLHYEVLRRGNQVNPLGLQLPTGRKLEGLELAKFRNHRAEVALRVANIPVAPPGVTKVASVRVN